MVLTINSKRTNMKTNLISATIALILTTSTSFTQITKRSIVEHFTNTSCSICANNNSIFYNIIANSPNTIHISFHPSSPYPSDFFNQQNQVENDDRTNFYGVFGGTPRLVVNGGLIQNGNLNATLSAAAEDLSNFEFKILQDQVSINNFDLRVVIRKLANDTTTAAKLFIGVIEDTIYQPTNNGETIHYNVFRKSITSTVGNTVQLPVAIGDSTVSNFNFTALSNWNISRLHSVGILQNSNKSLINSTKSANSLVSGLGLNETNLDCEKLILFPNPTKINVVYSSEDIGELRLFTISGELVKTINNINKNEAIYFPEIQSGVYYFTAKSQNMIYTQKLLIQ